MTAIEKHAFRLLAISAIIAGCASQPPASQTAVPESFERCTARVAPSGEEAWRAVRADGFAFCVPANWRPSGTRTWRGPSGSVTWSRNKPPAQADRLVAVPSGTPRPEVRSFIETIGGVPVDIRTTTVDSKSNAVADWRVPTIHFEGSPTGRAGADVYLEIFRTVRLAAGPGE